MDGLVQRNIEDLATGWIEEFAHALKTSDRDTLRALFAVDSHWRNICGITWSFATISRNAAIADALLSCKLLPEISISFRDRLSTSALLIMFNPSSFIWQRPRFKRFRDILSRIALPRALRASARKCTPASSRHNNCFEPITHL